MRESVTGRGVGRREHDYQSDESGDHRAYRVERSLVEMIGRVDEDEESECSTGVVFECKYRS
jgi:hypothetical protein